MKSYDAIVVGARCAGASTAMLLARKGRRVLLIDRDKFPSDMTASTHFVWSGGAERLQKWGLLDDLRATNCHEHSSMTLDFGEFALSGHTPNKQTNFDSCFAPRRKVLDNLIVQRAIDAGVEFIEKASVQELLFDNDRVSGVSYRNAEGQVIEVAAKIVVGADGMNSSIAKLTGAEEYNQHPKMAQSFYSYFSDVELDEVEFYARPGRMVFVWKTNDDQVLAGFSCPASDAAQFTGNEEAFWQDMESNVPELTSRLKKGTRVEPMRSGGTRGFMRKACGKGWALVGDAGLTMDPITAAGISNALWQADHLADAVNKGIQDDTLDNELENFAQQRDEYLGPHFAFTMEMAKLEPEPPEEFVQIMTALPGHQQDINDYFGIFAMTVPVTEFFDPENIERIIKRGPAKEQVAAVG